MALLLYNISIYLLYAIIKFFSIWNSKARLWIVGRKNVWITLEKKLNSSESTVWIHCASLGEFEQARPIIEHIKKEKSKYQILISFFSPSGYEIQKDYPLANCVCYIPLDTIKNAKKFISIVNPKLVIFIKYEFWIHFLSTLKNCNINTLLVCGIFRKNQIFFKPYGKFIRKVLQNFSLLLVQDENSKALLNHIGLKNVAVGGDGRFNRVIDIKNENVPLPWVEQFKSNYKLFVAGSTWKSDEKYLIKLINQDNSTTKFIIAPHNIIKSDIIKLKKSIIKSVILFSELPKNNIAHYDVMILDTIGLLTKVYQYADIGFIGGGFSKSGIHNVLEPAVFSIPVIIGPKYQKYIEAINLVILQACFSVKSYRELRDIFYKLLYNNKNLYNKTGASKFIYNGYNYFLNTKKHITLHL